MKVFIDGIVYGVQKFGGINVYFNELLPRLAAKPDVSVELWLPRHTRAPVPAGAWKQRLRDPLPDRSGLSWKFDNWVYTHVARLANRCSQEARARRGTEAVFHSSYFTWLSRGIVQVGTAYDMSHELFPEMYTSQWGRWLRRQYREYLLRSTRIIAISQTTKNDVVDIYGIDPSCVDVVHLAVDRSMFCPAAPASLDHIGELSRDGKQQRPYVLYVGLRRHYKNFPRLLEAMSMWPTRDGPDLVVAGAPWTESERESIQRLDMRDRVHLVVLPDQRQLQRLYAQSIAFVYPSLHEGFGIPLLEAMACGTAVVASDIAVFREVAGPAAVYFDPNDTSSIRAAIGVACDPQVRSTYVEKGFLRLSLFSWDRCADETYEAYKKALSDAG